MQFVIGAPYVKVYAEDISPKTENVLISDNLIISIKFEDGSGGNIIYPVLGSKNFPKEKIEIFGDNSVFIIDDFRSPACASNGRMKKKKKWFGQDKGHKEEIKVFIESLLHGHPSPIDFEEIVITKRTTFKIVESLYKGIPIPLCIT